METTVARWSSRSSIAAATTKSSLNTLPSHQDRVEDPEHVVPPE